MSNRSEIDKLVNKKDDEFTDKNYFDVTIASGNEMSGSASSIASSEWMVCETIQVVCFVIALYILYALIHFYTVQQSRRIYSGQSSGSRSLEKMCILAVICAIIRFANNQILLFTWSESETRCSILLNISIALYLLSLCPVYLFLWLRQRIFYSNKALKHLYNRVIRFTSWSTILCFFVVTIVSMVLFVVDPTNNASGRVCRKTHEASGWSEPEVVTNATIVQRQGLKVNTIAGLLGGAIQCSFLALFLYPIMDNKLRSVRNLNVRCHHSLLRLIRRAFVLSGVCIATDVTIAFGVKGVYSLFPNAVFALIVMYDVNLIINIICIVTTFRRWRRMLLPWMYDCCGKSILSPYPKADTLQQRQSTAGLYDSNMGSIRIKGKRMSESMELVVRKLPVVDVLMISDGEGSDGKETDDKNGKTQDNVNKENKENDGIKKRETLNDEKKGKQTSSRLAHFLSFSYPRYGVKTSRQRRYTTGSTEESNGDTGATLISSSKSSLRSKQSKNPITTKLVMTSESMLLMEKTS